MKTLQRFFCVAFTVWSVYIPHEILAQSKENQSKENQSKDSTAKKYTLPQEVTVTGSRLPDDGKNPRRTLVVVQRIDIERSAARSVEEVLRNLAGVDVRQRGPLGVQADISIRGGTFEQTLIMIDGVKMLDPQTGHHAMNIPLTLDDIERIEVLKGPGSRQYGPNAFNGAINIITRRHTRSSARVQVMGGEFGLWEGSLAGGAPLTLGEGATLLTRASFQHRRSAGYRPNTDFDITTASGGAQLLAGEKFSLDWSLNYVSKNFGGNGFYALSFPTQYEETRTLFANLTANMDVGIPIRLTAAWRRNNDYFILRRENPAFYQNFHTSNTLSVEAQTTLTSLLGKTALGSEYAADLLESTNLGNRQRTRLSIFAEHQIKPVENLTLEIGATALWNSDWGWNLAPGADIGWQVSESLTLRGSVAQSFRIPSYTELFYNDRVTRSNPLVQPERAWTFEIGGRWREGIAEVQASVFRRDAVQLIDYVRQSTTALWQAQNLSAAVTNGADFHLTLTTRDMMTILERITASYTYLDPNFSVEPGLQSRYVLEQLRHQAALVLDLRWFGLITNQWRFRYEQRLNTNRDAAFVDVRLGWAGSGFELYAEATNLLNTEAFDFIGLPLPGRWLRAGAAVNLAEVFR
ncbi:MAG: TonB-dependent receptor [Candidatus Kapabacteria bacterium]|nr:TonB-dependent receptor [Candidatus Kapabacteria bacterium]